MIWVVVANSNTCRIYHFKKRPYALKLVKEFFHPETKLKKEDLISDRPGHYKTRGPAHGAFSQQTDPKDIIVDNFAREVAKELEEKRNKNIYQQFILISDGHMNGLLHKHFTKQVESLIQEDIKKNLINLSSHELLDFLKKNMQRYLTVEKFH